MDANENRLDPLTAFDPPEATDPPRRRRPPKITRATWIGAKTGFRWVSYIAGPIVVVIVAVALTVAGCGMEADAWNLARTIGGVVGGFFALAMGGTILGGSIGMIAAVMQAAVAAVVPGSWRGGADAAQSQSLTAPDEGALPENPPLPRRRRIWPWLVGVPTLVAVVVTVVSSASVSRVVDQRLADAMAAADRDDPYWRLDDLMAHRDPVPDSENSAIVIGSALALLPKDWPQGTVREGHDRLAEIPANLRLDDATTKLFRSELQTHRQAVEILRTVASYRRGRHELELGRTLFDTLLPETQAARTAARLLLLDSANRAQNGDADGGLDSCRAIFGVARSIGDEPFAISQLVHLAIGDVALSGVRRVLGQGGPSDAALARLEALVLDELAQPLLLTGLKGERATLAELIRRIGSGEVPISALSDERKSRPDSPRSAIAPWGRVIFNNQRAVGLEWMNQAVAIARRPPGEMHRRWDAWNARIEKAKSRTTGMFTETLPLLMMPHITASAEAHLRYQANLGATAILLAAERHRRKTGNWPASIDTISLDLLPTHPVDPYNGQPLRMENRDGRIVVYSLGPNLDDEHGAYEYKRWRDGIHDDVGTYAWDVSLRGQQQTP
jgi:hypothetical protein